MLMYGIEIIVWNVKYRSNIQVAQMDNFRSVLGVKRINKMGNKDIGKFGEKGVIESILK